MATGLSFLNISQRERKLLNSLRTKKYREQQGLFIAEGEKVIEQLSCSFELELLLVNESVDISASHLISQVPSEKMRSVESKLMRNLSDLESRHDFIAIYEKKASPTLPAKMEGLCLGLEALQNPGNMGTLIRLCDWLGIKSILCSKGCVDPYSPKVVQATAGALGNVTIYQDIDFTEQLPELFDQVIGTTLNGSNYLTYTPPSDSTIILFGNEGSGLSDETLSICKDNLSILPAKSTISESLNVSLSAAILLSHLKQQTNL